MRKQVLAWFGDAVDVVNGCTYECILCASTLHTNAAFELFNILRHVLSCSSKYKGSGDAIQRAAAVALETRAAQVSSFRTGDNRRGPLPALSEQASTAINEWAATTRNRIVQRRAAYGERYHVGTA